MCVFTAGNRICFATIMIDKASFHFGVDTELTAVCVYTELISYYLVTKTDKINACRQYISVGYDVKFIVYTH